MKKLIIIIFIAFLGNIQAQHKPEFQEITAYYLFNVGYKYQNASYFQGGLNTYLVRPNNNIIDLGLSANLGAPRGKFTVIPEAHLGYHFNIDNSIIDPYSSTMNSSFWLLRASVSPWHVTPEAGIAILSIIEFTAGYGFEFREHNYANLEGFKFGFNLKLPFLLFWHD